MKQSTLICLYLSTLICLYLSHHAVLGTGSGRACKTLFHAPDFNFHFTSFHFVFAFLSLLNLEGSVLVAAYSEDRSSR
jgi:hypothetical protein